MSTLKSIVKAEMSARPGVAFSLRERFQPVGDAPMIARPVPPRYAHAADVRYEQRRQSHVLDFAARGEAEADVAIPRSVVAVELDRMIDVRARGRDVRGGDQVGETKSPPVMLDAQCGAIDARRTITRVSQGQALDPWGTGFVGGAECDRVGRQDAIRRRERPLRHAGPTSPEREIGAERELRVVL